MPRDSDKNNDSPRGRRDRPGGGGKGRAGGKGRSGAARGPEKKFAKRGFAGKDDGGERRPYASKPEDGRPPRREFGDRPPRFNREDRDGDRSSRGPRKDFRSREDRDG